MPKSICVQNVNPDKASLEDVLKWLSTFHCEVHWVVYQQVDISYRCSTYWYNAFYSNVNYPNSVIAGILLLL